MLEVQKYLQTHTFEQLTEELGIKCKVYEEDGIVLLDYDQIESPKTHPIVGECRSLILSLEDNSVVSRKFNRFFNHGEALDFYLDFSFDKAIAFEKVDGSLIGIYYNPFTNKWEISTRGMAKAEGGHYTGKTFREMVVAAFGFSDEDDFQDFARDCLYHGETYVFEYTSPLNRVVTPYQKDEMVLLSVVKNTEEISEDLSGDISLWVNPHLRNLNVRAANAFEINSVEDAKQLVNNLTGLQEGFVIYDPVSGKRMKLKSVNYLVVHKLKGNDPVPSRKNLLTATLGGDIDEFVAYFPEYEQYATPIKQEVETLIAQISKVWENVSHIVDQKEFALNVKDFPFSGVLFQAKKSGVSAKQIWNGLEVDRKLKMFTY